MTRRARPIRLIAILPAAVVSALPFVVFAEGVVGVGVPATRPTTLPAATQPATQPAGAAKPADGAKPADAEKPKIDEKFLLSQRQQRDNARNNYAGLPDGGEAPLSELVNLTMDAGVLKLDVTPRANQQSQRFRIKGEEALCLISRSPSVSTIMGPNGLIRTTSLNTSVTRMDLDVKTDTDIWSTYIHSSGNYLSINGRHVLGQVSLTHNLSARLGAAAAGAAQPINFTVMEWQPVGNGVGHRSVVAFRGGARTMAELRSRHPAEFRKHLIPLLRKVSDLSWLEPGAADVYAVFDQIPADPAVVARVEALLPDLGSDAAEIRDDASKRLMELGAPGALAALRFDPAALSAEQKGQLGRLVAAHRRRDLTTVDARKDPSFLVDCLEYPDPAVRAAAKNALEPILKEVVQFEPSLTASEAGVAADRIRTRLVEIQSAAATQPAPATP